MVTNPDVIIEATPRENSPILLNDRALLTFCLTRQDIIFGHAIALNYYFIAIIKLIDVVRFSLCKDEWLLYSLVIFLIIVMRFRVFSDKINVKYFGIFDIAILNMPVILSSDWYIEGYSVYDVLNLDKMWQELMLRELF